MPLLRCGAVGACGAAPLGCGLGGSDDGFASGPSSSSAALSHFSAVDDEDGDGGDRDGEDGDGSGGPDAVPELLRRLRRFAALPALHRAAARAAARALPPDEARGAWELYAAAAAASGAGGGRGGGVGAADLRCLLDFQAADESGAPVTNCELRALVAAAVSDGERPGRGGMEMADRCSFCAHSTG